VPAHGGLSRAHPLNPIVAVSGLPLIPTAVSAVVFSAARPLQGLCKLCPPRRQQLKRSRTHPGEATTPRLTSTSCGIHPHRPSYCLLDCMASACVCVCVHVCACLFGLRHDQRPSSHPSTLLHHRLWSEQLGHYLICSLDPRVCGGGLRDPFTLAAHAGS
jgi:hypothetical protein